MTGHPQPKGWRGGCSQAAVALAPTITRLRYPGRQSLEAIFSAGGI